MAKTISISDELYESVATEARRQGFSDPGAYVSQLIDRERERREGAAKLQTLLDDAEAEGECEEDGRDMLRQIIEEGRRAHGQAAAA